MKHLLFLALLCLAGTQSIFAQSKLQVTADTIRVINAELLIQNSSKSVQGYLYNVGNGVTQFRMPVNGKNIQFKTGQTGYPATGDTVFVDTGLVGRAIKVWRNGMLQYRDSTDGIMVDSTIGKVIFHPALAAGDRVYVEGLSGVNVIFKVLSTNTFSTNLTVLNGGVFDNGSNSYTLRWTTNDKTLTASPRVVGIGGSTLAGYGLTSPDRIGDKISAWLTSNTTSPTWINLAVAGYATAQVMPTSLGGTAGHNIDSALASNPDFLLIMLPSNDAANNVPLATTMANLRMLDTMCLHRGVIAFIETAQPRTQLNAAQQTVLKLYTDSVRAAWPTRYIEGFKDVLDTTASTDAVILAQYAQADNIHLTSAGNQFIANRIFARWQGYFVPVTGVSSYTIETSTNGTSWSVSETITDPTIVKKTYTRADTAAHYFRVKANYTNGTVSAYSNTAQLAAVTTSGGSGSGSGTTTTGGGAVVPGATGRRVLIDIGGDGSTTKTAGVALGALTPSPDSLGKYWNNFIGLGGQSGFNTGATISNLVTTANSKTSLQVVITGNPAGTYTSTNSTNALNYNGTFKGGGDYPWQATADNMYLHSSIYPTGVTFTISGMEPSNNYSIRLWGARVDSSSTTARNLEASLDGFTTSKSVDTRYNSATLAADTSRAIWFTNITGVQTATISLRPASGSTFAHLGIIDINATDSMKDVGPKLSVADMSTSLPADSVLLTPVVTYSGTISSYAWTQLTGPSTTTIVSPTGSSTIIRALTNGVFTFQLKITTSTGLIALDTVKVTAYPNNSGLKTLRVNFSLTPKSIPGWLNAYGQANGNYLTYTDATTAWTLNNGGSTITYWDPLGSTCSVDSLGQTTGNNSGVVPDLALYNYWYNAYKTYTSGTNNLIVGGLNTAKTYTVTLVGSRASSGVTGYRYSSWHVQNGSELLLNALGNTSGSVVVTGVVPDSSGKINIGVYIPSNTTTYGSYSYINALIVQEN